MKLKKSEILNAVKDPDWQKVRKSLKGKSTSTKLQELNAWENKNNHSKKSQIQKQNYINALKRGGQIK